MPPRRVAQLDGANKVVNLLILPEGDVAVSWDGKTIVDAGNGRIGDTYDPGPPEVFTTPTDPALNLSWSGDGVVDPDDGVYEMVANGVNTATLTIDKINKEDGSLMSGAGDNEKFSVGVCIGQANPSVGRVQLASGTATVVFVPDTGQKGMHVVEITSIDSSIPAVAAKIRFV